MTCSFWLFLPPRTDPKGAHSKGNSRGVQVRIGGEFASNSGPQGRDTDERLYRGPRKKRCAPSGEKKKSRQTGAEIVGKKQKEKARGRPIRS